MSSSAFLLSSTYAIAGSEDAVHLIEQKERIEQAVVTGDPALTLDTSKAFLESVFKTILSDRVVGCDLEQDLNPLFKSVRDALSFNRDKDVNALIGRLSSSVVHNVGELRNRYGAASHGKDGHYLSPIEMPEAELVARLVDSVAGFVFHKHKANGDPSLAVRIYYQDYPDFNDFLDGQYSGYKFEMDGNKHLEILPSKLLFMADESSFAYREMLLQFMSSEGEGAESLVVGGQEGGGLVVEPPEDELSYKNIHIPYQDGIDSIIAALLVSDEAQQSVSAEDIRSIAEFVISFAINDAGIDWQAHESRRATFKNKIRRRLIKVSFSEAFLDAAVDSSLEKAAELYPSRMGES